MTPKEVLMQVLPEDLALDVIQHRKGLKCPLTATGAKALVKQYQLAGNAVEAAEHHLNVGWRGFKAEWMNKGSRYQDSGNPMPKQGGAPQTFHEHTELPEGKVVVLPKNHFSKTWKARA
jgi:hypothetical protein